MKSLSLQTAEPDSVTEQLLIRKESLLLLWLSQLLVQSSDSMSLIAIMWSVYKLTGSPLDMGTLGFFQKLPIVLLGLPLGTIVDRVTKKNILVAADLLCAVLMACIPLLAFGAGPNIIFLYLVVFVVGALAILARTAIYALVPSIARREKYQQANSFLRLAEQVAMLIGPGFAALVSSLISPESVLYVIAVSYGLAALCLARISITESPRSSPSPNPSTLFADLHGALNFMCHRRVLLLILIASIFSNALALPLNVAIPILSDREFHAGASGFGLIASAIGSGMIFASLVLMRAKQPSDKRIRGIFIAILVSGLAYIGIGTCQTLNVALMFAAIVGICVGITNTLIPTEMQDHVPPSMLGKAVAVLFVSASLSGALGMLAFGPIITVVGPNYVVQGAGFLIAAFSLALCCKAPTDSLERSFEIGSADVSGKARTK